jgi:C4-dicarboxylate-specific signal transduction histidine kinase
VGSLTYARPSGRPTIVLAYPVHDLSGRVTGTLGVSINLTQLQTVFAKILLPGDSIITLTDTEDRVLARTREADKFIGQRLSGAEAPSASPLEVGPDTDGVDRIHGRDVVPRGPWTVTVGIPRAVVTERLLPLWTRNILIVGIASIVVLALGAVVAWQTTLHLTRLRSAAQRIADGDLSTPERIGSPNLEFAALQDAFIEMATNLRTTRDALDRQVEQERRMNDVLQSLQLQVVRQERLAAVGLLVSGVAHELNNPLQAILGAAELLERNARLPPEALEEIAFLKTQSGRAREIIRNLSRFSNQQSGPPTLVDLRDVIAEVVQLRRHDLESAGIHLDVQIESSRMVQANFTELEQVTLNFVINAQQALESAQPAQGRILIRLADAGRKVRLEVHDNGPGVKAEDEPKLFQPFFTTKPVGKGTGLGLSVSYGIIDSYGGAIGQRRNAWGGATFFFELSASDPASDAAHDRPGVLQRTV